VSRWLQTAHAGSSLADFSTLRIGAIRSSETSGYTSSTRRNIPEDGILHSHRRENLKSYVIFSGCEQSLVQSCEQVSEPSGTMKCGELPDKQRDYLFYKSRSASLC
jgi:hypothetical protein